jgi:pyruvate dehydrogenase E2 component (dihydrolipoamide acetyltransferase)
MKMPEQMKVIALTPMRKAIAARMTAAKQTIPHFRLSADIEVDQLLLKRNELTHAAGGVKVSINDLLVKACGRALTEVPELNIQLVEGRIHQYQATDIAVVIAIEGGLAAPIIRDANSKSIYQLAREIRDLSMRASANHLKMAELVGGTFSISNLGMYGVDQFDAIINPPQCAILAVARAKPQVVVASSNDTRIATIMRVTLSLDHRALDGVAGARFLGALRRLLENPTLLCLDT